MAFRDLLVHVDFSEGAVSRIDFAMHLARKHEAHLTALLVAEDRFALGRKLKSAEMGLVPAAEFEKFRQRQTRELNDEVANLKSSCAAIAERLGVQHEWQYVEGRPRDVFAQQARYADAFIIGQEAPSTEIAGHMYSFAEEMLFSTGRPLLYIPASGSFPKAGTHVLVAWNSSRFAARAVADALPILELAERVTVLSINSEDYGNVGMSRPMSSIVQHLKRHCGLVELKSVELKTGNIGLEILRQSAQLDADLVVAGGYGHPRLWEKMLGGVTRDLLSNMDVPLLMSH